MDGHHRCLLYISAEMADNTLEADQNPHADTHPLPTENYHYPKKSEYDFLLVNNVCFLGLALRTYLFQVTLFLIIVC